MTSPAKNATRTGFILLVFALVGTAALAWTFTLTHPAIEKSEEAEKLKLLNQVMPVEWYDNNLIASQKTLPPDSQLGTSQPSHIWFARKRGQLSGLVLEAIAPDGYSGDIALLIGITPDGEVLGVRVTAQHETPGLGDYIDIAKSPWIKIFDHHSLTQPDTKLWKVKKDGGAFDSVAGATITPRAVVKAVLSALEYYAKHRDELLSLRPAPNQRDPS
ncbi:MAG: electron transport complex subunit RsxG [Thiobacillaceae bacterium]|jgi:electron transport complex protein RnfG